VLGGSRARSATSSYYYFNCKARMTQLYSWLRLVIKLLH